MNNTTTLIKNISSNYIRAQQDEREGDDKRELQHLIFAVRDITLLLQTWADDRAYDTALDDITVLKYAESMHHSAERIRELVMRAER